jgi:hypothetical protein
MKPRFLIQISKVLTASIICGLLAACAFAHPASGIVVSPKGEVFFIHTGRGACKIEGQGKLTYIHKDTGGHWMALDTAGSFASAADNRLFKKIAPAGDRPLMLFASGGAPLVVSRDGNLYYGSGFPGGDDTAPGGHMLTRMSPDGKQTLFAPELKSTLAKLEEAITGLAADNDGSLLVACPNAILKVKLDGTVTTLVHPVVVKDCDFVTKEPRSRFFHAPYLRGLDVAEGGVVYAAATGCGCVVKVTPQGQVETVLKAESPWVPTGVAVRGKEVFVLEYSNANQAKPWAPRVRKLGPEGQVTTLATAGSEEK